MDLVIAEKPSVAKSIADVLGAKKSEGGYWAGNGYIVSWCVGHLVELSNPESYDINLKKWSYATLPIIPQDWQTEVKADTKAQYKVLEKLLHSKDVDMVVCATDAGREGELIFRLVVEKAGCKKPMKRLWISSMEEKSIRDGFANLKPLSDYDDLYQAALARQRADWLVGLNGTRLFTILYGGGKKTLKVGRVQTPTLAMLVQREDDITNFKKEPYYIVHCIAGGIDAISERFSNKQEAENLLTKIMAGRTATVSDVADEDKKTSPPLLYDLTTLQRDANSIFGFTAKQTLDCTQSLYEKKLCTYPRTDSKYLSDDMEQTALTVIAAVADMPFVKKEIASPNVKRVMNSKKVSDHHAIIPTVVISSFDLDSLPDAERKILFLIANRLLCATGENHEYTSRKVILLCSGEAFTACGNTVTKEGWKDFDIFFRAFFKLAEKEKELTDKESEQDGQSAYLPPVRVGQTFEIADGKVSEHFTKPPSHYTESSLLAAMEKAGASDMGDDVERKGLGTPATRADIIEKLVKDGFVKREKKKLIPTEDGRTLILLLPDLVKSVKLTSDMENALALVAKGSMPAEKFMGGVKKMVCSLVENNPPSSENTQMFGTTENDKLGKCPKCGKDVVKGKFGAYCSGKCGMSVGRAMGAQLTDSQIKSLLNGKKTLVKGLKGKKGNYDAYLIPDGVEDYSYEKDGREIRGSQFKFKLEFPTSKK